MYRTCVPFGNSLRNWSTYGANSAQCGQPYENTSTTSTAPVGAGVPFGGASVTYSLPSVKFAVTAGAGVAAVEGADVVSASLCAEHAAVNTRPQINREARNRRDAVMSLGLLCREFLVDQVQRQVDGLLRTIGRARIQPPFTVDDDRWRAVDAPCQDLLVGAFHLQIDGERIGGRDEIRGLRAVLRIELCNVRDLRHGVHRLRALGRRIIGREFSVRSPDRLEHGVMRGRRIDAQCLGGQIRTLEYRPVFGRNE